MKDCILCDIIKYSKNELVNTTLFETELFVVKPAKGMVVPGQMLLIPKQHINGFAELSINYIEKARKLCEFIEERIERETNNKVILFEHGSLHNGRHPESIVHAHMHIIPYTLSNFRRNKMIKECKLKEITSFKKIKEVQYKDYWFFKDNMGKMYMSHSIEGVPRSIFFRLIAEQEGLGLNYEWRNENDIDKIIKTIKLSQKIFH